MLNCERCQDSGWDTSLYREPKYCEACSAGERLKARNVQWEKGLTSQITTASNLSDYQKKSRQTYKDLDVDSNLTYPVLGMLNEAGEFAGKYKKIFRDKGGVIDEETRLALRDELAAANLEKVLSRLERGKIHGNGDNR